MNLAADMGITPVGLRPPCMMPISAFRENNRQTIHLSIANPVQTNRATSGSQTNLKAARKSHCEVRMRSCPAAKPVIVRQSKYMNNRIEQDHRRVKRRIRPMLGFQIGSHCVCHSGWHRTHPHDPEGPNDRLRRAESVRRRSDRPIGGITHNVKEQGMTSAKLCDRTRNSPWMQSFSLSLSLED